jgi:hypothetical protein
MVRVISFWEQGWNTPIKEYDLWHFPSREFKVDELVMIPISGIFAPDIKEYQTFEEMERDDSVYVFVDEDGEECLEDFIHPENATYVVGRSGLSSMKVYKKEGDKSVKIKSPLGEGMFWGHQIMSILLYDRMKKLDNCNTEE